MHEFCVTPLCGEVNKFWVATEKLGRNMCLVNVSYPHVCVVDHEQCMLVQHKLGYAGIPEENKHLSV